ncbi:MAG: DUF4390 domain-containing protein [Spirochaetota bacterium]|nr:MAG: DUF4390 domain-containing protein [Spirochaetota bacterium]
MKRKLIKVMMIVPLLLIIGILMSGMFIPGIVYAENLTIQFTRNTHNNGQYRAYFTLKGDISYDTIDAIRNGITAKLLITFQLTRSEGFLGLTQNVLREKIREFNISYDVWENTFIIEEEGPKKVYQVERTSDIVRKIYEMINPVLIDVSSLKKDDEISLRARINIQTIKLYPPFGIFLYFFDPWNYDSDWIYSNPFTLNKL